MSFVRTDLTEGIGGPFDLIVSNPPYIPEGNAANLPPEVLQFEPHTSLFGGVDGLAIIRRLLSDTPSSLAPKGRLIIEFGLGQEEDVRRLAHEMGWRMLRVRNDLQGIPRTAVLEL